VSKILPQLQHLAVPIENLTPDPANPRRHPARNLAAIMGSLKRFGQRQPLVVQEEGMIVRAGNGRLEAAVELGWTEIAAVIVPESEVEATAYAIADNRTSDLAEWDEEALSQSLMALRDDLEGTGFTDDDLKFFEEGPDAPEDVWKGTPEFQQDDKTSVKAVLVHFECMEAYEEFQKLIGQKLTEKTKSIWYPEAVKDSVTDKRFVDGDSEEAGEADDGAA
jgi:hypothetical protein